MRAGIPVTVVTGFLGAGKTTRVNEWLRSAAPGEIAVIVNEHGDVGIDGELLAARAKDLREITGGCICCRTQAELVRALDELASSSAKRILVETSGAASPAGVLRSIAGGGPSGTFALDGVITVVDATRPAVLDEHELAVEQVGYADVVVLSRADIASSSSISATRDLVEGTNGAASVIASTHAGGLDDLLASRRADFTRAPVAPAGRPHVYESVSLSIEGDVDGERFADFVEEDLAKLGGRIFRLKGILAAAGIAERMIVQGVADLVEVTFGDSWGDAPRRSRVVIVGFGLDRAALERSFEACAVDANDVGQRSETT